MSFLRGMNHSIWSSAPPKEQTEDLPPTSLDPTVPRFTPEQSSITSMELQRHQSAQPATRSYTYEMAVRMEEMIVDSRHLQNRRFESLDRQHAELYDDFRKFRRAVGSDIQTLEQNIAVSNDAEHETGPSEHLVRPEDSMSQMADAEALVAQNDELRKEISRLQALVESNSTTKVTTDDVVETKNESRPTAVSGESHESGQKLPPAGTGSEDRAQEEMHESRSKGTKTSFPAAKQSEFMCCDVAYDDISSMLEHVKSVHITDAQAPAGDQLSLDDHASQHAANKEVLGHGLDEDTNWRPLAVRQMPASPAQVPDNHEETFSFDAIKDFFKGWEHSFSFYIGAKYIPSDSYWLLEADHEPFLPTKRGEHGAKLTAFWNPGEDDQGGDAFEDNYLNVPVFIRPAGSKEYMYFGQYSQTRYSDKIDYDTLMSRVPEHVRQFWADVLSARGRPKWVTKVLEDFFFAKPAYDGPISGDAVASDDGEEPDGAAQDANASKKTDTQNMFTPDVMKYMTKYLDSLKENRAEAKLKVSLMTSENLMKSFETADEDSLPGLRLSWEYLQCVGYDVKFYELLVKMKAVKQGQKTGGSANLSAKAHGNGEDGKAKNPAGPKVESTQMGKQQHTQGGVFQHKTTLADKKFLSTSKPWEKNNGPQGQMSKSKPAKEGTKNGPNEVGKTENGWGGDIEAARAFQAQATKGKVHGGKADEARYYMPPHQPPLK